MFSLARPLAAADRPGLSLAVGVALADAIDPPAPERPVRVGLKWPNDLWLVDPGSPRGGRKLGGVLIETVADAAGARAVVIGIGINVLPGPVAEAASGFAWLREIDPGAEPLALLARIVVPLVAALDRFERAGWADFAASFARRDILFGRAVRVGAVEGVAAGVAADGELLVRGRSALARVVSGEVQVGFVAEAPC